MAKNRVLSHDGWVETVVKYYGNFWSGLGENIHAYVWPNGVVQSWMESPAHKTNILNTNFYNKLYTSEISSRRRFWLDQ